MKKAAKSKADDFFDSSSEEEDAKPAAQAYSGAYNQVEQYD